MNDMFCAVRCGKINIYACVQMRSTEFWRLIVSIDMFTRARAYVHVMCYFGKSAVIKCERYAQLCSENVNFAYRQYVHNLNNIYQTSSFQMYKST